ncbi:MAG: hypothetical protein JXR23_03420 [Pontiellaceae bacterium]|nr:hypothetical protein [Pontiellaceae bacterium]
MASVDSGSACHFLFTRSVFIIFSFINRCSGRNDICLFISLNSFFYAIGRLHGSIVDEKKNVGQRGLFDPAKAVKARDTKQFRGRARGGGGGGGAWQAARSHSGA